MSDYNLLDIDDDGADGILGFEVVDTFWQSNPQQPPPTPLQPQPKSPSYNAPVSYPNSAYVVAPSPQQNYPSNMPEPKFIHSPGLQPQQQQLLQQQHLLYLQQQQQQQQQFGFQIQQQQPLDLSLMQRQQQQQLQSQNEQKMVKLAPPRAQELCDQTIAQVILMAKEQEVALQNIMNFQRNFFAQPSNEAFNTLATEQAKLKKNLEAEVNALDQLKQTKLLSPTNILNLFTLRDKLFVQHEQLKLLDNELLAYLKNEKKPTCPALLLVEDQPFPNVYFKEKKALEQSRPVKLRLVRGALPTILAVSSANVTCIFKNNQVKANATVLDNSKCEVDQTKGGQFFCKFLVGTRKETAQLRFDMAIKLQSNPTTIQTVALEPVLSRPFVVITNESQFEDAFKKIILQEVYRGKESQPWPLIANELSVYFLKATRQDLTYPERGLSDKDISFLHKTKFGGHANISAANFEKFWDKWFGNVLRELRYKRHLRSMWNLGFIYGFIDKDNVKNLLSKALPGHFILRFSDRFSGSIAVNTLKQGGDISNYLIKAEETTPKKTHADILRTKKDLTHVLQFMNQYTSASFNSSSSASSSEEIPVFQAMEKDVAFEGFYTTHSSEDMNAGYDDWDGDNDGGTSGMSGFEPEDFLSSFVFKAENNFMQ